MSISYGELDEKNSVGLFKPFINYVVVYDLMGKIIRMNVNTLDESKSIYELIPLQYAKAILNLDDIISIHVDENYKSNFISRIKPNLTR